MEKVYKFNALMESDKKYKNSAFIRLPFGVKEEFGTTGQVKVDVTFDGHRYRGSISNMGNGHFILIRKDIRAAINKAPGDTLKIVLKKDVLPREVEMPESLVELLSKNPKAADYYKSLSYTNRKEYAQWISSAKREETVDKRLKLTLSKLLEQRKNPSDTK